MLELLAVQVSGPDDSGNHDTAVSLLTWSRMNSPLPQPRNADGARTKMYTNNQILDCPASEAVSLCLLDELHLDEQQEMVDIFVLEINELLVKLHEAMTRSNYENAKFVLRAMKGMCSMIGAHGVSNLCNMLHGCKMEKEEWNAKLAILRDLVQQSCDFFENAVVRKGQHVGKL